MNDEDPTFYEHIEVLPIKPSMEAASTDDAPCTTGFHPPDVHALQELATLDTHCGDGAPSDWPAAVAVAGDLLLREVMGRIVFSKTTALRLVLISPLLHNVEIREDDEAPDDEPVFLTSMRASFLVRGTLQIAWLLIGACTHGPPRHLRSTMCM